VTNQRQFDTLTPEVKLRVNGNPLADRAMSDLVSVSVLEDVDAAGMFTFTLISWNNREMRVVWLDDDQFKEEMAKRREKLHLKTGDVVIGCPLCMVAPAPTKTTGGQQ